VTVKTGQFVITTNRYTPPAEVHADNVGTIPVVVNGYIPSKRNTKVNDRNTSRKTNGGIGGMNQKKKKIIVIGDSHARGCARELSSYLGKDFEVSGTVMPEAGLAHITTLAQEEIPNLTPYDAVVIWGGSNDINKSETSRGLTHLTELTSSEALRILHQNIQGLRWKSNEVIDSVYHSLPHILCFTEHHLNRHEINLIQIDNYTLGAFFCRNSFKMGGVRVCIFVNKNLNFMNIDLQ